MFNEIKKTKVLWNRLMNILSLQQKRLGIIVLIMTIIGAFLETLGVSVIIPFIQAMTNPEQVLDNKYVALVLEAIGVITHDEIIIFMCVVVVIVYVTKNLYLIFLSWVRSMYSCKIQRELSVKVMTSYMKREYEFFLMSEKNDLVRGTRGDISSTYNVILLGLRTIAEALTAIFVALTVFISDPAMMFSVLVVGIICVMLIYGLFKKRMQKLGTLERIYNTQLSKCVLEAYEGIKEIFVMNRRDFFVKNFED